MGTTPDGRRFKPNQKGKKIAGKGSGPEKGAPHQMEEGSGLKNGLTLCPKGQTWTNMEKNLEAVIAEDVKKVEKKIKFSKICEDLWKLANNVERKFIDVCDSLSKIGPFLTYFENVENITSIDFNECNEDTKEEFKVLIKELHDVFNICPFYLTAFGDFWEIIQEMALFIGIKYKDS